MKERMSHLACDAYEKIEANDNPGPMEELMIPPSQPTQGRPWMAQLVEHVKQPEPASNGNCCIASTAPPSEFRG
jgi:hypothetical protein